MASTDAAGMTATPLFRVLATAADSAARLGLLALPRARGPPLPTPALVAVASRGAVPHVTPDNAVRHPVFAAAYLALEDFVETKVGQPRRTPPILDTPSTSSAASSASSLPRLHAFTALPPTTLSVLAARRHPAAAAHLPSGPDHLSILTSTGQQRLSPADFSDAVATLQPDIAIPMADLTYSTDVTYPTAKRALRMAERSMDWVDDFLARAPAAGASSAPLVFAPTLPVPYAAQWSYLEELAAQMDEAAQREETSAGTAPVGPSGLAVYDVDLLPDLCADYAPSLARLPRLSLHPAPTPHHVLRQIALGVDLIVLPGINAASEAGLALDFAWDTSSVADPVPAGAAKRPLAIDLADPQYAADVGPLAPACDCPACAAGHHRAYLHHLLDAREMLAWTLLQLHNYHVVDRLLAGVRATLADAPDTFEAARHRFHATYDPELPSGQAVRPRIRGYQSVPDGRVDVPLNKPAWGRLEEVSGQ